MCRLRDGRVDGKCRQSVDNAGNSIEAGANVGAGSAMHRASVVEDTVGGPFKVPGVSGLNILIKLMSMLSVVFAGLVVQYGLQALGVC